MAKSGRWMGVDRDLRNLAGRELVGALYLERGGPGLDLEPARQRRRNQRRCDLLMDLDDALAEQIFDQMKDRAGVALQQPAYRGEFPVDVDFGPAHRELAAFGVPKAADREPFVAARNANSGGEFIVGDDHLDGIDRKAHAGRES